MDEQELPGYETHDSCDGTVRLHEHSLDFLSREWERGAFTGVMSDDNQDVVDVAKIADDELFEAPVTQFLLPHGRRRETSTKLPISYRAAFDDMVNHGCSLQAEMLMTGQISMTIWNPELEEDIDISVTPNGPEVQTGILDMLKRGLWK